jgi:hypothetical protein
MKTSVRVAKYRNPDSKQASTELGQYGYCYVRGHQALLNENFHGLTQSLSVGHARILFEIMNLHTVQRHVYSIPGALQNQVQ